MAIKGRAYELVGLGTTVEGEAGSAQDGMVLEGFLKEETFELSLRSDKIPEHRVPSRAAASEEHMGYIRAFGGVVVGPRGLRPRRGIGEQEP